MATRVVRDAVHGLINLDRFPWLVNLVNTREFQRLRRISQLGTSSATYPGATHSRTSRPSSWTQGKGDRYLWRRHPRW